MRVQAKLLLDDGRRVEVTPGAILGRMPQCAVRIEDPRVSEAHALVSLRGAQLRLLALRGRLSVDGKPKTDIILNAGLNITLASFFRLTVEAVELPANLLAISLREPPWDTLGAHGVVAIHPHSASPLRAGYDPEAEAHIWTRDAGSFLRRKNTTSDAVLDEPLLPGSTFQVAGREFGLDWVQRDALEARPTTELGHDQTRLNLVLNYDSVRITSSDGRSAIIDGIGARALCELYEVRSPIAWQEVAQLLWPEELSAPTRRQRWDQLLTRVRMRLREAGLRSDLLRSSQRGLVELVLGPEDTVEDRT